jgi:hypothetical protein
VLDGLGKLVQLRLIEGAAGVGGERWLGKTGQWDKWRFCPSLAYDGLTEEIG